MVMVSVTCGDGRANKVSTIRGALLLPSHEQSQHRNTWEKGEENHHRKDVVQSKREGGARGKGEQAQLLKARQRQAL